MQGLLKPFNKNISTRKLFFYWFCFFIVGVFLMVILSLFFPSPITTEDSCDITNTVYISLAPFVETLIFMIFPYYIFKKSKIALLIGIGIWALLHLLTKDITIFVYILFIGYFYFRCMEIGRWKFIILVHAIINFFSIIVCFM